MVDKNGRLLAELVEQKGFFGTTIIVIKHCCSPTLRGLTQGKGSDSSYQQGMMNAQTAG